jgi:hypothetical protein
MYQRSSRRPLTILVGLSLALNGFLIVTCMQLKGNLDATDRKVRQMSTAKADSEDLARWASRMRGCLYEIANGGNPDNVDKNAAKACGER